MKNKLLIFFSSVLLFTCNVNTSFAEDLPSLPSNSLVEVEINNQDSPSFWQKFKGFFGFGEEEKKLIVAKPPADLPELPDNVEIKQADNIIIQKKTSLSSEPTPDENLDQDNLEIANLVDNITKVIDDNNDSGNENKIDLGPDKLKITEEAQDIGEINAPELKTEINIAATENDEKQNEPQNISELVELSNNTISVAPSNNDEPKVSVEVINTESIQQGTEPIQKAENFAEKLPIPAYAGQKKDSKDPKDNLNKIVNVYAQNKNITQELPKIGEEDYKESSRGDALKKESIEIDAEQLNFMNNEVQVLILPNDDVVLGKLTQDAILAEMDLYDYINEFWSIYNKVKREPQREEIEEFISELYGDEVK